MKPILVFDENNSKCTLLKELFNFIGSKNNRKEMSRNHISTKEIYMDLFLKLFLFSFFSILVVSIQKTRNINNKKLKICIGKYLTINIFELH